MRNQAFAFVKPHAMQSQAVATYIGDVFEDGGVRISFTRRMTGPELAASGVVDRHFARLAAGAAYAGAAPLETADEGREAFKRTFNETWDKALKTGRIVGADLARAKLKDVDAKGLCTAWANLGAIEVGPDLYVAWFEDAACYVLNGFYPAIRESYLAPGAAIQAMLLEFEMPWREFHETIVGADHPEAALEESIRGYLYDRAGALEMIIDPVDNILHASASPLDALREKTIWLDEAQWRGDPLLAALAQRTGREPHALVAQVCARAADPAVQARFADMDTERVAEDLAAILAG